MSEIVNLVRRKQDLAHNLAVIKSRLKNDHKELLKTERSIELITDQIIAVEKAMKKIKYNFED